MTMFDAFNCKVCSYYSHGIAECIWQHHIQWSESFERMGFLRYYLFP